MTLDVAINLNSLQVIEQELSNTIKHSATELEAFLADTSSIGHIQACHESMKQVGGIFRLLEYPGAALLADEMAELVSVIADPEKKNSDAMINSLTHGYFVLPNYIEYITVRQTELPILVLPYVNEMRASRRADLIPESHCFFADIPLLGMSLQDNTQGSDIPLLLSSVKRLRQMFQVGLIGVIKDPASTTHYDFMQRAVARLVALLGDHFQAEIWQLARLVLEAFAASRLEMTLNRKRVLAELEKMMRAIVSGGEEGLNQAAPEGLKRELMLMLILTSHQSMELDQVRSAYAFPHCDVNDDEIARQRGVMHGPSFETIESVIKVLAEELRNAKDILEIASQNKGIEGEDFEQLLGLLSRVADTLLVLNLNGPRDVLTEQLGALKSVQEQERSFTGIDFIEAADTLLYIESALTSLDRRELTVDDLNKASSLMRKKIVANSQLAQAQQVVIEEATAGIALAKRAISSYVESNFDIAHISNVSTTLETVRGGLHIMNYSRAAAVLKSCNNFVSHHIAESCPGDQRHQLLETLADALISLEYYLNELETKRDVNEDILLVAEESLAALGFAVDTKA